MSPLNCTIIRYDIIMTLINFTKEELYKIESCILGDGDSLDRERVRDILVENYGYDSSMNGGSLSWIKK